MHRDLKPGNIFLHDGTARLTDFGLACALSGDDGELAKGLAGTPPYIAPELWNGGEASEKADVYSLGILLFEVLTGAWPFEARTLADWKRVHTQERPRALPGNAGEAVSRLVDPTLPASAGEAMASLVAICLAKNPADRPTLRELGRDLSRIRPRQAPRLVRPPTVLGGLARLAKRAFSKRRAEQNVREALAFGLALSAGDKEVARAGGGSARVIEAQLTALAAASLDEAGLALYLAISRLRDTSPAVASVLGRFPGMSFDLSKLELAGRDLHGIHLPGGRLVRRNLARANLADARLARGNLSETSFSGGNLRGADLSASNLAGADLSDCDLTDANLRHANLARANLRGARLGGAHLDHAVLAGASLEAADLTGARAAGTGFFVHGATLDERTVWDEALNVVDAAVLHGSTTLATTTIEWAIAGLSAATVRSPVRLLGEGNDAAAGGVVVLATEGHGRAGHLEDRIASAPAPALEGKPPRIVPSSLEGLAEVLCSAASPGPRGPHTFIAVWVRQGSLVIVRRSRTSLLGVDDLGPSVSLKPGRPYRAQVGVVSIRSGLTMALGIGSRVPASAIDLRPNVPLGRAVSRILLDEEEERLVSGEDAIVWLRFSTRTPPGNL